MFSEPITGWRQPRLQVVDLTTVGDGGIGDQPSGARVVPVST
ncbi:hypothetical protein ACFV0B_22210 [Streptomyces xanthophaeus]